MIIDGRFIAKSIGEELHKKIAKTGKKFTLAVFLVGNNPASANFIAQKEKFGNSIGVHVILFRFSPSIPPTQLKKAILRMGENKSIHGIIVQLPIPKKLKPHSQEILDTIPSHKDPDFLNSYNQGLFYSGKTNFLPPPVAALNKVIEAYNILFKRGAQATVIGQGMLIGKPTAAFLLRQQFTVVSCNKYTKNIKRFMKTSDLVVSGVGVPNLIRGSMLKRKSCIIDFGFSRFKGKIVGDIDEKSVKPVAQYLTPVPGGMGPITVAMLFKNLVDMQP